MCIDKPESDPLILTLPNTHWDQNAEDNNCAIEALEQGKVLFLPHLTFELSEQENSYWTLPWLMLNAKISVSNR